MVLIKVSRGNDLLYETWANNEGNITSLSSAIRTVQKESNKFLSKIVEEEKLSNNNSERNSGDGKGEDEEDDEDSEEDADKTATKEVDSRTRKRANNSASNANKKLRADK